MMSRLLRLTRHRACGQFPVDSGLPRKARDCPTKMDPTSAQQGPRWRGSLSRPLPRRRTSDDFHGSKPEAAALAAFHVSCISTVASGRSRSSHVTFARRNGARRTVTADSHFKQKLRRRQWLTGRSVAIYAVFCRWRRGRAVRFGRDLARAQRDFRADTNRNIPLFSNVATIPPRARSRGGGYYSHGSAVSDFDRDGWPDIYLAGFHGCSVYRNNQEGGFEDVTASSGLLADHVVDRRSPSNVAGTPDRASARSEEILTRRAT